jgi:UDP-N-acetylmuramate dehydrogenase
MQELRDEPLSRHTTLRVGGPANRFVVAESEAEIIDTIRRCDDLGEQLFILGHGSNVVANDSGFDGTVLHLANKGMHQEIAACAGASVTVGAGETWDDFVAHSVDHEWSGIEALSGIPGTVGACPIQNVGAYGQDVSQTIARVRAYDRTAHEMRTFYFDSCEFGYRTSVFKQHAPRLVVIDVQFQLRLGAQSMPVTHAELAKELGIEVGKRSTSAAVRQAVLQLRASKGMVLDPADHDSWSAGSFFINPTVDAQMVPAGAPAWPQADGKVKVSAAWLVDHAGIGKGYAHGGAATSTRHALAITNRGQATASDIKELANLIRARVRVAFSIELEPEPTFVNR